MKKLIMSFIYIIGICLLVFISNKNILQESYSISSNLLTIKNDKKISSISSLNKSTKSLDSNKNNTKTSTLETNYREINTIDISSKINGYGTGSKDYTPYVSYPRLFSYYNSNSKKNEYILVFQSTQEKIALKSTEYSMSENGIDIYYMTSTDLNNWSNPKILFKSDASTSKNWFYGWYSGYVIKLNDNRLIAISSKWAYGVYGYNADQFNTTGIYAKYSSDYGKTWTSEVQITKGPCWDPSMIQLPSGEIQIYMTQVAQGMYMQSLQYNYSDTTHTSYHAKSSSKHNSAGIGMVSSLDNGKTWTPDIKGTNNKYNGENITTYNNPYAPYVVAQEYVTYKRSNVSETLKPINFYNMRVLNSDNKTIKTGTAMYGLKKSDSEVYQMGGGMASPLLLNNGKMVLPSEATNYNISKVTENGKNYDAVGKSGCSISLYYSNPKKINVSGKTLTKYWLDINNSINSKNSFNSEKDIYNNGGLNILEQSPINKTYHVVETGSGPDIEQFPSGETVLSYHLYPNMIVEIGDNNANFSNSKLIQVPGRSYWGSVKVVDPHKVILLKANRDDSTYKGSIIFNPMYLNHTIDVKNENVSENDDALFIGSDSQAQMTTRVSYDDQNIYFTVDVLDKIITKDDIFGIYLNSKNLKYNNTSYDFIHVIVGTKGITKMLVQKGDTKTTISEVKASVYVNDTKDNNGGYEATIIIPRKIFNLTINDLKVFLALKNIDNGKEYYDTMTGTSVSNTNTWINLNLIPVKENVVVTPVDDKDKNKDTEKDKDDDNKKDNKEGEKVDEDKKNQKVIDDNKENDKDNSIIVDKIKDAKKIVTEKISNDDNLAYFIFGILLLGIIIFVIKIIKLKR